MTKTTLNIAQVHWGFPPTIGGVETHLTLLLPQLVKNGHRVGLLTASAEGRKELEVFEGVDVYRTPLMDLNWLVKRGIDGLEQEIRDKYRLFLDRTAPDVIHAHNMHYFSKPHAALLKEEAKRRGVPLVLTAHNAWDDSLFLELCREVAWDHIIAVSHYIKRELMGVLASGDNITVIHHGIDTEMFRPGLNTDDVLQRCPRLRGRRIVFHPARMGIAKGCDTSIKAVRLVRERIPDVLLVLGGAKNIIDWELSQGRDITYFVDLVKVLGLQENVFIDAYSLAQMPGLYNAAEVCVYPSSASEPFGLTMLESLACEKPMIVTNMGGMPEIIRDDINGYVVGVRDFRALAARIVQLLEDETTRKRLGKTGRDMVRAHSTLQVMTQRHEEIYRAL